MTPSSNPFPADPVASIIFWIDPEGRILDASDGACRALGYDRETLLTLSVRDVDAEFPCDRWPDHWRELRQAKTLHFRTTHRRRDGSLAPVEVTAHHVELDGREYNCALVREITPQRQTETALRESEERLALALAVSGQGLYDLDITTGQTVFSDEYARMLGYEPSELVLTPAVWASWLHPEDRERTLRLFEECVTGKRSDYQAEFRLRARSGEWIWVRSVGKIVEWDATGRPLRMVGTHLDITERKRTEQALRESEARFRSIFEHAPLGIGLVDGADGRILISNAALQQMLGYRAEQLHRLTLADITHPDDIGKNIEQFYALLEGRISSYRLEKRYLRQDGATIWANLTVSAIRDAMGHPLYALGMVEDITGHRQAQQDLRESEERFAKAFRASPAPMAISVIETGQFLDVNEQWLKMLGYSRKETIGHTSTEINLWIDPGARERMIARLRADGCFREAPIRVRTKAGATLELLWSAETIRLGAQEVMLSLIYDITERTRAEEALRLTQFSVDRALDSIVWVDDEGKLIYVNDAACASIGYTREELLRMKVFDIDPDFPPEKFEEHKIELQRCGAMKFESRNRAKDGRVFPVEVTTNYLEYKGRFLGCAFARDITDRKRAEAELQRHRERLEERVAERTAELRQAMNQLVQSEKLAALGHLVAGVAHELNTPLGNARVIAGALGAHLREFAAAVDAGALRRSQVDAFLERGREAVDLLERNVARAADLIGHFKQVAVDQASARRRRFNLRRTVEELLATLQPQIKRTAHRIELEIPPDLDLDSYPGPLEQVIANLVTNSLTHGFAGMETGTIRIHAALLDADRVQIDYTDNGIGIPKKILNRVFEPFFTTKLGSGGSGLGLYIVYNLVAGVLGGTIDGRSPAGRGVHFTLVLPRIGPDRPVEEPPA